MSPAEVAQLIGQLGLPTVLVIALAYAYDRQNRAHQKDREKWEGERERFFDRQKEDSDRINSQLLKMHETLINVVNKASDMAGLFEQEKKEIREERQRELRDTSGAHRPAPNPGPPRR